VGPEQVVYDYEHDKCAADDIPDASARAFRDSKGTVHLVAGAPANHAMVGPDLDHLHRDCRIIYQASHDSDPSHFDDEGWLESFFTGDGVHIYGLVSMDYHPDRHQQRCGNAKETKGGCWYATITSVTSSDDGYNFGAPPAGDARFVAGSSRTFNPDATDTTGALVPSNIVNFEGAYFALVSVTTDADGKPGECIMRTTNIHDAKSWRFWDGHDFTLATVSPYKGQADKNNACVRLHDIARPPVRSLSHVGNGFVIVMLDQSGANSQVIAQTSSDLIHWSAPIKVADIPVYRPNGGLKGEHAYYYPSLIDGSSKSPNLDVIGNAPYLYLTRYAYGEGLKRDIVRIPLRVER
jgi:hypothetical protein